MPSAPTYKFPLSDQQDYKGRIIIDCVQEDYKTLVSNFTARRAASDAFQPEIPEEFLYGQEQQAQIKKITKIPQGKITLYLPQSLQFADAVEYTNVDLGAIGGATALGIRAGLSGSQIAAKALSATIPSFESISDAVTQGLASEAAQAAALRTAGRLSESVKGAIETETGITLNPNRRSTFRGVGLRKFNFTFSLIPNSPEEAREIKEIIGFFRMQMYPDTYSDFDIEGVSVLEGASVAFRFPPKFNIKLMYGSKRVGTGILPCFLEGVDVVYNPNAMAFHKDEEVQETQLTLRFVEERALTQKDIIKDNIDLKLSTISPRGRA